MSAESACLYCDEPLPAGGHPARRYCNVVCRTGAYKQRVRQRQRQEQVEQLLSGRPLPRTLGNTPEALAHLQAVVEDAIAVPRLLAVIAAEARSGNWRAANWLLTNVHGVNPKEHSG